MLVTYRAAEWHLTETVRGKETLQGSTFHPELTEFTGLVTRFHGDGNADLVIFPPGRAPVHVENVPRTDDPGGYAWAPILADPRKS